MVNKPKIMLSTIALSLAPVLVILLYIYSRDKYEKEPIGILLRALLAGIIIVLPTVLIESWLSNMAIAVFPTSLREVGLSEVEFVGNNEQLMAYNAYNSFLVAGLTEELLKYLAFILLIWRNKNFNELFDGIIYASYISLGFAAVENLFYVFEMGTGTGILRAFTAVPGHALFGVAMGYYFGIAKFNPKATKLYLALAFVVPFVLHGIYDFILLSGNTLLLLLFIPFIVFLWILGFYKMRKHAQNSIFNPENSINNLDEDE